MTNEDYRQETELTEKKFPEGLYIPAKVYHDLADGFSDYKDFAKEVDKLKKAIVYKGLEPDMNLKVKLSQQQAEFLHAAMGLITETAEILDALGSDLEIKDRVNFAEELGDLHWYIQIFLRHLQITQEEIQQMNIKKLRTRFPDAFTSYDALHRDIAAERKEMEAFCEGI